MSDTTLAARAVACKGWRWMPGMKLLGGSPNRVVGVETDWLYLDDLTGSGEGCGPGERRPDLDDPATLGCLLALVREAWGPRLTITESHSEAGGSLIISYGRGPTVFKAAGGTLAGRRVAALEAAP